MEFETVVVSKKKVKRWSSSGATCIRVLQVMEPFAALLTTSKVASSVWESIASKVKETKESDFTDDISPSSLKSFFRGVRKNCDESDKNNATDKPKYYNEMKRILAASAIESISIAKTATPRGLLLAISNAQPTPIIARMQPGISTPVLNRSQLGISSTRIVNPTPKFKPTKQSNLTTVIPDILLNTVEDTLRVCEFCGSGVEEQQLNNHYEECLVSTNEPLSIILQSFSHCFFCYLTFPPDCDILDHILSCSKYHVESHQILVKRLLEATGAVAPLKEVENINAFDFLLKSAVQVQKKSKKKLIPHLLDEDSQSHFEDRRSLLIRQAFEDANESSFVQSIKYSDRYGDAYNDSFGDTYGGTFVTPKKTLWEMGNGSRKISGRIAGLEKYDTACKSSSPASVIDHIPYVDSEAVKIPKRRTSPVTPSTKRTKLSQTKTRTVFQEYQEKIETRKKEISLEILRLKKEFREWAKEQEKECHLKLSDLDRNGFEIPFVDTTISSVGDLILPQLSTFSSQLQSLSLKGPPKIGVQTDWLVLEISEDDFEEEMEAVKVIALEGEREAVLANTVIVESSDVEIGSSDIEKEPTIHAEKQNKSLIELNDTEHGPSDSQVASPFRVLLLSDNLISDDEGLKEIYEINSSPKESSVTLDLPSEEFEVESHGSFKKVKLPTSPLLLASQAKKVVFKLDCDFQNNDSEDDDDLVSLEESQLSYAGSIVEATQPSFDRMSVGDLRKIGDGYGLRASKKDDLVSKLNEIYNATNGTNLPTTARSKGSKGKERDYTDNLMDFVKQDPVIYQRILCFEFEQLFKTMSESSMLEGLSKKALRSFLDAEGIVFTTDSWSKGRRPTTSI